MNLTDQAIHQNDLTKLQALREQGTLKWSEMSTLAIYKKLKILKKMYQWTLEDNITSISVPAFTESIDDYLSHRVLIYLVTKILENEIKEFFILIRKTKKLDYDRLICHFLHDARLEDQKFYESLDLLIEFAKEDSFTLDYQKFLNRALSFNKKDVSEYLRDQAKAVNYTFDWQKLTENHNDLRLIIRCAKEDNHPLTVSFQDFLEKTECRDYDLTEFYILQAKKANQTLNWGKLLELSRNNAITDLLKEHMPPDYELPTYPESFDIDVTANENVIGDLAYLAMRTTEIEYVIYQEKKYYPRSNQWYDGPDERPEHDPDVECEGYMSDCEGEPEIFPKGNEEIKYHLSYDKSQVQWNDESFSEENQELIRKIQHADPQNVQLKGSQAILLINPCGVNSDHRGSDHCKVSMDFHSEYILQLPCTLMDFMKAVYRLKSHKWDKWYELYGGVTTEQTSNFVRACFSFDHGS